MMKTESRNKGRVVLVTGASTGVGLALVKILTKDPQFFVVATARESSLGRFEEAGISENEKLWIRPMDVLKKKERDSVVREIISHFGRIDVLINNAGYMLRAVVEHVGEVERFQQMDTNFRAPMALIRAVLPHMRSQRFGRIINISSVGGMMAMPTMAVYSASKFALEGASEALWYEVKPWNICVSLIQPGFIKSDGHLRVKQTRECLKSLKDRNDPYFDHYNAMVPFIQRLMGVSTATPEKVARVVLRVIKMRNPPLRVSATLDAHFFIILRRLLPRSFYHWLLYLFLPKISTWGKYDK